jgi:hypothetical protein
MNRTAKKKRLIPDEEYHRLIKQSTSSPSTAAIETQIQQQQQQMDNQMSHKSTSGDYSKLGDDQKWKLYQSALHRMLESSQQLDKKPVKVQFDTPLPDFSSKSTLESPLNNSQPISSSFVDHLPKIHQAKASGLKQYLENCESIEWGENGEVSLHGFPVQNSHISDLISHLIKPTGRNPVGWDQFVSLLSRVNIPLSLIGNTAVKNSIIKLREVAKTTPKKQSKRKSDLASPSERPHSTTPTSTRPHSTTPTSSRTPEQSSANGQIGFGKKKTPRKNLQNGKGKKKTQCGKGWKNRSNPVSQKKKNKTFRWKTFG